MGSTTHLPTRKGDKMLEINPIQRVGLTTRIDQITQRIAKIEENFQIDDLNADFQSKLDKEIERQEKLQKPPEVDDKSKTPPNNSTTGNDFVDAAKFIAALNNLPTNNFPDKITKYTSPPPSREEKNNPDENPQGNSTTEELINTSAHRNGVDPALVRAVAIAESDMNQDEISPVGAIGVMQLMPETAAALGVDPYDEEQNIEGGVRYLRQMLDQFGGNVPHALAAYNAGPAAVQRYGGIPPYSETQAYVGRILDIVSG